MRRYPFVLAYLPFIAFATWELGLPWYSFLILSVGRHGGAQPTG